MPYHERPTHRHIRRPANKPPSGSFPSCLAPRHAKSAQLPQPDSASRPRRSPCSRALGAPTRACRQTLSLSNTLRLVALIAGRASFSNIRNSGRRAREGLCYSEARSSYPKASRRAALSRYTAPSPATSLSLHRQDRSLAIFRGPRTCALQRHSGADGPTFAHEGSPDALRHPAQTRSMGQRPRLTKLPVWQRDANAAARGPAVACGASWRPCGATAQESRCHLGGGRGTRSRPCPALRLRGQRDWLPIARSPRALGAWWGGGAASLALRCGA